MSERQINACIIILFTLFANSQMLISPKNELINKAVLRSKWFKSTTQIKEKIIYAVASQVTNSIMTHFMMSKINKIIFFQLIGTIKFNVFIVTTFIDIKSFNFISQLSDSHYLVFERPYGWVNVNTRTLLLTWKINSHKLHSVP